MYIISVPLYTLFWSRVLQKRKVLYRTTFLFGLCLLGAFATGTASLSSAGPLGVICTALVARIKWRLQGWTGVNVSNLSTPSPVLGT